MWDFHLNKKSHEPLACFAPNWHIPVRQSYMFIFLKVNSQLQNAKNSLIIRGLLREWMHINQTCMDMSLCHFERGMRRGE